MKLQKLKATCIAAMVAMATLMTTIPVYAAEVSAESTQIKQNEEKSTVFVFGASIAMAYDDGTIEIIPNNPSGRVDVMIAGKLYKGMGKITISARKEKELPNMVLEKNSFFVKGVTQQTAAAVSEKAKQAILANTTVSSLSDVKGLESSGILYLNNEGKLETPDGKTITADKAGVSLSTVEQAYSAHEEALKKVIIDNPISNEVTISSTDNTDNGPCKHPNLRHFTNTKRLVKQEGNTRYYATKFDLCPDCYMTYIYMDDLWIHGDVEGANERHSWEFKPFSDTIYIEYNSDGKTEYCYRSGIRTCNCQSEEPYNEILKNHSELGETDYCNICGFNKNGEQKSNNTSSETSQTDSENPTSESDGE